MSGATRLVAAGAILALSGGPVAAGTPTQPSAAPAVTLGVSSDVVAEGVNRTTETLRGLRTRRLGPGIVRVMGDGTGRSLDDLRMLFIAGDGTVWAGRDRRVFRLGVPGSSPRLKHAFLWYTFSASEDGNIRAGHRRDGLQELRDGKWVAIDPDTDKAYPVYPDAAEHIRYQSSDGAWWFASSEPAGNEVLRYREDRGWESFPLVGAQATAQQFIETPDGSMWAVDWGGSGGSGSALFRFDGERWERQTVPDDESLFFAQGLRLDEDGALIVNGIGFDGERPERVDFRQVGSSWTAVPFVELTERFPVLYGADLRLLGDDDTGWAIGEDGRFVVYLDGEQATRIDIPVRSRAITPAIHRFAVAPDGSLWLTIQSDHPSGNRTVGEGLYVVTLEAVAATEDETAAG